MQRACSCAAILVVVILAGCSDEGSGPRELTEVEQKLVAKSNGFGFDLFSEVVGQSDGGNVFISPLSVSVALGMTLNGARGGTAEAMSATLGYAGMTQDEINAGYRDLIGLLTGMDPEVTFEIADSIWYAAGLEVLPAFVEANRTFFDAVVQALDFASPSAAQTINDWVADKTHGKIAKIIDQIGPDAVMYLLNAVYFKGTWTYQFDPKDTADAPFHTAEAGDETVKMMRITEDSLPYYGDAEVQMVDLPYGDGYFRMAVLLPAAGTDLDDLVDGMDGTTWSGWMEKATEQELTLELPRFELDYEVKENLNAVLTALGMGAAFDSGTADFSGMVADGGLFISEVKHKTYVKLDEEGTEAAAITSVEMDRSSAGDELVVRVDRPFLVVIHDAHSQSLLFMGKIVAPPSE